MYMYVNIHRLMFRKQIELVLPLPGSAQCNDINLAIISKEQSILWSFPSACGNSMD